MDNLRVQKFREVNLNDPFFDSLKESYKEFAEWFTKKHDDNALVLYGDNGCVEGFLYCKFESRLSEDIVPSLPDTNHMKVGTFKFNAQGTRRGERYLKKIFDYAFAQDVDDIYVTVFAEQHQYLVDLFSKYGFIYYANKKTGNGVEQVLLRNLNTKVGEVDKDYPLITTEDCNKYLLAIYPQWHTKLFPDSKLSNEPPNIVKDISYSNSIHKIYLCNMKQVMELNRGDIIVIYRTGDKKAPAEYTSVATSLCVVEDVHTICKYQDEEHFVRECVKFSIFNDSELRQFYRQKSYPYVINFTYNVALPKRLNRRQLADDVGLNRLDRWGFLSLSDDQFNKILNLSNVNPKFLGS